MTKITRDQIRLVKALQRKKHREATELFIVEGVKLTDELLVSGWEIKALYGTAEWSEGKNLSGLPFYGVKAAEMERMSGLKQPNEVLAVVGQRHEKPDLPALKEELVLALDDVKDPGNMGTIIRTAEWFGIRTILCSEQTVEVYNSKVVQASMGSVFRVKVYPVDLPSTLAAYRRLTGQPVAGALLEGDPLLEKPRFEKGILVMGSESHGISQAVMSQLTQGLKIPAFGQAESLNVATATAIILYEFRRG